MLRCTRRDYTFKFERGERVGRQEEEAAGLLFQNEVQNEIDMLSRKSSWTASPGAGLWCEERNQAGMVLTKIGLYFSIFTKCADGIKPDRPYHSLVGGSAFASRLNSSEERKEIFGSSNSGAETDPLSSFAASSLPSFHVFFSLSTKVACHGSHGNAMQLSNMSSSRL